MRITGIMAILVLALILFPSVTKTFLNLHKVNWYVLNNQQDVRALKEFRKPGAGTEVLPEQVQLMLRLLKRSNVVSFRFSPAVGENPEIMQRLVEGAYPLRVMQTSRHLIHQATELVPAGCSSIASEGGVSLAYCP